MLVLVRGRDLYIWWGPDQSIKKLSHFTQVTLCVHVEAGTGTQVQEGLDISRVVLPFTWQLPQVTVTLKWPSLSLNHKRDQDLLWRDDVA